MFVAWHFSGLVVQAPHLLLCQALVECVFTLGITIWI